MEAELHKVDLEKWLKHIESAMLDGYYFEVISICHNLINHFLRKNLILKIKNGTSSYHYVDSLFGDSKNPIGSKLSDRNLYEEAKRFRILDAKSIKNLHRIHNERNMIFHSLFSETSADCYPLNKAKLKELSESYLSSTLEVLTSFHLLVSEKVLVLAKAIVEYNKNGGKVDPEVLINALEDLEDNK